MCVAAFAGCGGSAPEPTAVPVAPIDVELDFDPTTVTVPGPPPAPTTRGRGSPAAPTGSPAPVAATDARDGGSAILRGWLGAYRPYVLGVLDARERLPDALATDQSGPIIAACEDLAQAVADATGVPAIPDQDVDATWRDALGEYESFAQTCQVAQRTADAQLAAGANAQLATGDEAMSLVAAAMLVAQADGL